MVPMMADIYHRAERVLAWLGRDDEGSECLVRFFNQIPERATRIWPSSDPRFSQRRGNTTTALNILAGDMNMVRALVRLTAAPYWSRQWIIQELAVARAKCLILYDEAIVPLATLCQLHTSDLVQERWGNFTHVLDVLAKPMDYVTSIGKYAYNVNPRELLQLMAFYKNPRDHIYAIQSMFPEYLQLPVDYNIPVDDLFLDACVLYCRYLNTTAGRPSSEQRQLSFWSLESGSGSGKQQFNLNWLASLALSMEPLTPCRSAEALEDLNKELCDIQSELTWHKSQTEEENKTKIRDALRAWMARKRSAVARGDSGYLRYQHAEERV